MAIPVWAFAHSLQRAWLTESVWLDRGLGFLVGVVTIVVVQSFWNEVAYILRVTRIIVGYGKVKPVA